MPKIDEVIAELVNVMANHGNIETRIMNNPQQPNDEIISDENVFVVAEPDKDGKMVAMIRNWPY